jgi:zinc protease
MTRSIRGLRIAAVLAATFAAVTPLAAQRAGRPAPPAAAPAPVYVFPKVQTRTLPNGLVVQIVENHALPLVAVRAVIEGGPLLDPVGKEGLSALDLSLLPDGTSSMTADQLSQAIDQLGATVSPIRFTAIADELPQALPLMGEMLMHPTFPAAAVEQRKAATTTVLQRNDGRADTTANRLLNIVLFGAEHRYGRMTTPATIASITRDDLVRFHDANVRPQNVTLVVVGDVTPATVMPLVTRVFGAWEKTGARADVKVAETVASHPTTIYLLDRPSAPQTTVRFGRVGPSRSSPDYFGLDLGTAVLGGGTGARLSKALREQRALTYGVSHITIWRGWNEPSVILGSAQVDAAKTDSALMVWMGELKDLAGGPRPITEQEVEFGRALTVGNLATRYETFDAIANQVALMARDHLPTTFVDEYVRRVNGTSAAAATRIVGRYLGPDQTAIVVVGDRKTIEQPLRAANLGPVVIIDASGKPIL